MRIVLEVGDPLMGYRLDCDKFFLCIYVGKIRIHKISYLYILESTF